MISFTCPACKAFLTKEDRDAGSKLPCPKCGQRLQVPAPPANKTVLGQWAAPDLNATPSGSQGSATNSQTRSPDPQTPAGAEGLVPAGNCPSCGMALSVPAQFFGQCVQCPQCATAFTASPGPPPPAVVATPTSPFLTPSRGALVLTLGVLALIFALPAGLVLALCGLSVFGFLGMAPVGLVLGWFGYRFGREDLARMTQGTMSPAGRGMTQSGWICSLVGMVVSAGALLLSIIYLLVLLFTIGEWNRTVRQLSNPPPPARPARQEPPPAAPRRPGM